MAIQQQQVVSFESLGLSKTANTYVDEFLVKYFFEVYDILSFEQEFIKTNGLKSTKIDYTKLRRFITTALNNFQSIDSHFLTGLLLKLQNDVFELFDYISDFVNKTKIVDVIYGNEFLKSIPEYVKLQKMQEEANSKKGRFEDEYNSIQEKMKALEGKLNVQSTREAHKKLKLQLGDVAYHFSIAKKEYEECAQKINVLKKTLYPLFLAEFKQMREKYVVDLLAAANTKAYYLDKYLWYSAQKSKSVANFLKTANIDGDYDMKTYIKYYLKNINSENTADRDWHHYLLKVADLL